MVANSGVPLAAAANVSLPLPSAKVRLHGDDQHHLGRAHELNPSVAPAPPSSFHATGPPSTILHVGPYWTTEQVRHIPPCPSRAIAWEHEAACALFLLDPLLLLQRTHEGLAGATGELVWFGWGAPAPSVPPAVRPALRIRALRESASAEHVAMVPSLTARDPLVRHMALLLQATLEGQDAAEHLYAAVLANALAVHFLKRYQTSRHSQGEVTGGLSPYKLRRTTAYIQAHLAQELSLVTLAAVGETSPAHFARLFKHATGLAPHQYVIQRRMEQAKQLLAETDAALSAIGLQVGCADQSHFTALFHKHVRMTPKAYRENAKASSASGHRAQDGADA